MKERIRIFANNSNGKIEFTKEELEKLLQEIYDEGYNEGRKNYCGFSYGNTNTIPYYGTYIVTTNNVLSNETIDGVTPL